MATTHLISLRKAYLFSGDERHRKTIIQLLHPHLSVTSIEQAPATTAQPFLATVPHVELNGVVLGGIPAASHEDVLERRYPARQRYYDFPKVDVPDALDQMLRASEVNAPILAAGSTYVTMENDTQMSEREMPDRGGNHLLWGLDQ